MREGQPEGGGGSVRDSEQRERGGKGGGKDGEADARIGLARARLISTRPLDFYKLTLIRLVLTRGGQA